jgi:hypothetical protein
VVSGNIEIKGGEFLDPTSGPATVGSRLRAPGGTINLASVAAPGEVPIIPGELNLLSYLRLGNIRVDQSTIDVSGGAGGSIFIRSGVLTLINKGLVRSISPTAAGGVIDLATSEQIQISGFGSGILSNASTGDTGPILITTPKLVMENFGGILGSTLLDANGANISVNVGRLIMRSGAVIDSSTLGSGKGGDIEINATNSISISGSGARSPFTFISSLTAFGSGAAGIILVATPQLTIDNGGKIQTSSFRIGNGRAGGFG